MVIFLKAKIFTSIIMGSTGLAESVKLTLFVPVFFERDWAELLQTKKWAYIQSPYLI